MEIKKRSTFVCDACGEKILNSSLASDPDATLEFSFGYDSKHDGLSMTLHFNTENAEKLLSIVLENFPRIKEEYEKKLKPLRE